MEVCASTDQSTQLYIYMRYVLLIFTFYFTAGTWFRVGDNITLSGTTSETFKFADFAGNTLLAQRERDKLEHHIMRDEQGGLLAGTLLFTHGS